MPVELRMYDRLFTEANPSADKDKSFMAFLNPESLVVLPDARAEIGLKGADVASGFQFERMGYFSIDPDSTQDKLVVNRTVTLRDSWTKS